MTITLTPSEVRKRFGVNFCRGFFTIVDRERGLVRIVEKCIARGPVEWDHANRIRAGGALRSARIEGTTLIMDAEIGRAGEVRFGPAAGNVGGQALVKVELDEDGRSGNEVRTTWRGIAGASMGIGACIPASDDVIRTEYSHLELGGANELEVTIITPAMTRLIVGLDDTDTKEKGASWVLALKMAQTMPIGRYLTHRIIQLYPGVPEKTTNCVSIGVSFAVPETEIERAKGWLLDFVKRETLSDDTTVVFYTGLDVPDGLRRYGQEAKRRIISLKEAEDFAREEGLEYHNITGLQGLIGAIAAVGCFEDPNAAMLHTDAVVKKAQGGER